MEPRSKMLYTPSQIGEYYDVHGAEYVEFTRESFSWNYIEKPSLDSHLLPLLHRESRVLDIGSGGGRMIEYMVDNGVSPENIQGLDVSATMIEMAKVKHPKVKFKQSDITYSDLPKLSFDVITGLMMVHYLNSDNLILAMKNCHRMLKSGGALFLMLIHPLRQQKEENTSYFDRDWRVSTMPYGAEAPFFHHTISDILHSFFKANLILDVFDEPQILSDGKEEDASLYESYASLNPKRLLIGAKKTT